MTAVASESPAAAVAKHQSASRSRRATGPLRWGPYENADGCMLNLFDAPAIISDAQTLEGLIVRYYETCDPRVAAGRVDFHRQRLFVGRVEGAGFNPNTQDTIRPTAVVRRGERVEVHVDVAPSCGGAEVGPGFVAIVLNAGDQPVDMRNLNTETCSFGGQAPPP